MGFCFFNFSVTMLEIIWSLFLYVVLIREFFEKYYVCEVQTCHKIDYVDIFENIFTTLRVIIVIIKKQTGNNE